MVAAKQALIATILQLLTELPGATGTTGAAKTTGASAPTPTQSPASTESTGTAGTAAFPAGIFSLQEWGLTLVDFGKYGADNLSYTELYHSTLAGHACYVKWVRSRSRNLNGQFKDLGLYIARMGI